MILAYLWTGMVFFSLVAGILTGNSAALASAALEGAQTGLTVTLSMAGALCLWTGLSRVMEESGISAVLGRRFRPVLGKLFPQTAKNETAM